MSNTTDDVVIDEVDALIIEHAPRRLAEMVLAARREATRAQEVQTRAIANERASALHTLKQQVGRALASGASEYEWDDDVRREINTALEDLDIKMTGRRATGTVTISIPISAKAISGRNNDSFAAASVRQTTTEAYNDNGEDFVFGLDSDWEDVSFGTAEITFDLEEEDDDD